MAAVERNTKYQRQPEGGAYTGNDLKQDLPHQTLLKKAPKVRLLTFPPDLDETSAHKEGNNWQILETIFPPKQWTDGTGTWVQRVSGDPSTRADVIQLEQSLNTELQLRHARQNGICPIRSELYSQCFDELIRQMAINCGERGLLLFHVRQESQATLAAYQTLYESSIAVGIRKALLAEKARTDVQKRVSDLEKEKEELEKQLAKQKAKNFALEMKEMERKQEEKKRHNYEIRAMKRNKQLHLEQLEKILTPKKKLHQTRSHSQ